MGVKTVRYDKNAMPVAYYACSHPILPVEILKNVDTAEERIIAGLFQVSHLAEDHGRQGCVCQCQ